MRPTTSRKRHGKHYTPVELANFLATRSAAHIAPGKGKLRVLDPACGDGELLLSAAAILTHQGHDITELVGLDLDENAIGQAQSRLGKVSAPVSLQVRDFVRVLDEGSPLGRFDLIITNPPYVRTQVLGAEISRQLAARFDLKGRVDLTHAFVAIMRSLLAPGGVIALLCSNRFLSTRAGINTRRMLSEDYCLREVYDLGDTKLFQAAVLPAIVVGEKRNDQRREPTEATIFTRVYEAFDGGSDPAKQYPSILAALESKADGRVMVGRKNYLIETGELVNEDPRDPWRLGQGTDSQWYADVMAGCWKTFGEITKIRVGIKTTADSVFIRDNWDDLPESNRPESQLLLPLITHYDTRAWKVNGEPATKVLYPYDLKSDRRRVLSLADYPRTRAYLQSHEARLRGRRYVTEGGREWFEIWVPQRPSKWAKPKLVFPDISEKPQFSMDFSGAVVNGDCYWISCEDLPSMDLAYLMLAVANSSLGVRFYDLVCGNKLYSGKRRWITQYVDKLPLPDPADIHARKAIELARSLSNSGSDTQENLVSLSELDSLIEKAFLESDAKEIARQPDLQLSILDVAFEALEF